MPPTAKELKELLWSTARSVADGEMPPKRGEVVARDVREILRTVRMELMIHENAGTVVSKNLRHFAELNERES